MNLCEVNSVPLSHLIFLGLPLIHIVFSSSFTTRSDVIDIDISWAIATRPQSSITLRMRNLRPHSNASLTKSIDHVVFGSSGCTKGLFVLAGNRLRRLQRLS